MADTIAQVLLFAYFLILRIHVLWSHAYIFCVIRCYRENILISNPQQPFRVCFFLQFNKRLDLWKFKWSYTIHVTGAGTRDELLRTSAGRLLFSGCPSYLGGYSTNILKLQSMHGTEPRFQEVNVMKNTIPKRKRKINLDITNKCQHVLK